MKRRARRCLGIDIGSTSLKVAEVSHERSGVVIHRLLEAPLELTPETSPEDRWAAIQQTLRDLLRSAKVSTRQAVFALPGHAVFVRRVRLPRTSEERLQRIIRFEARQQIPFPLEQTLLQYQISSTEMEEEVEVLLVAIKRDLVEHYMGMIKRLGLQPISLGVTSFALFNFHMYNQGIEPDDFDLATAPKPRMIDMTVEDEADAPEPAPSELPSARKAAVAKSGGLLGRFMKKKAKGAEEGDTSVAVIEAPAEPEMPAFGGFEEVKAYLNIGANTMDLAIGRMGGSKLIGFSRSIPLAGNQLTRVIQDQVGAESFADAERIKRERAQVILPGSPVPPESEKASRAIMPTIDRMIAEIRRSLDFYISQPDGMAVDRVVLSGGQATLPNLAGYLEERLALPVEVASEVQNAKVKFASRDGSEIANHMVSLGLALQGVGQTVIAIDFLPEHLKGWLDFKQKNLYVVTQVALVGAMVFVASLIGGRMTQVWDSQATVMQGAIDAGRPMSVALTEAAEGNFLLSHFSFVVPRAAGMDANSGVDRNLVFTVLETLNSVKPARVFFTDIRIGPHGDLIIRATTQESSEASEMVDRMQKLPNMEKAELTTRSPGTGTVTNFEIVAKLKGKFSKIELTPIPYGYSPTPAPMQGPGGTDPRNTQSGTGQYDS